MKMTHTLFIRKDNYKNIYDVESNEELKLDQKDIIPIEVTMTMREGGHLYSVYRSTYGFYSEMFKWIETRANRTGLLTGEVTKIVENALTASTIDITYKPVEFDQDNLNNYEHTIMKEYSITKLEEKIARLEELKDSISVARINDEK